MITLWSLLKVALFIGLVGLIMIPLLKFVFDWLSQKMPNKVTESIATYADKA